MPFKTIPTPFGQGTCYNTLDSSENVLKRSGLTEGLADNESGTFLLLCNGEAKRLIAHATLAPASWLNNRGHTHPPTPFYG